MKKSVAIILLVAFFIIDLLIITGLHFFFNSLNLPKDIQQVVMGLCGIGIGMGTVIAWIWMLWKHDIDL